VWNEAPLPNAGGDYIMDISINLDQAHPMMARLTLTCVR
jgi:hypothetical protein